MHADSLVICVGGGELFFLICLTATVGESGEEEEGGASFAFCHRVILSTIF